MIPKAWLGHARHKLVWLGLKYFGWRYRDSWNDGNWRPASPSQHHQYGIVLGPDEAPSEDLDQAHLKAVELFDYCAPTNEKRDKNKQRRWNYFLVVMRHESDAGRWIRIGRGCSRRVKPVERRAPIEFPNFELNSIRYESNRVELRLINSIRIESNWNI
jgi:hypothetical protein